MIAESGELYLSWRKCSIFSMCNVLYVYCTNVRCTGTVPNLLSRLKYDQDDPGDSNSRAVCCRQESIKQAERERHKKYKKQEDEREVIRQGIRDKVEQVWLFTLSLKATRYAEEKADKDDTYVYE